MEPREERATTIGRPLSAKVAKERAAILEAVHQLRSVAEYAHHVVDQTNATFSPVLRPEHPEEGAAQTEPALEYLGSSQLYEELRALIGVFSNANLRLEDLNRRAEV